MDSQMMPYFQRTSSLLFWRINAQLSALYIAFIFYYFLMLLYTIMLFAIGEYIEGGLAYIYGNDRRPWAAFPAPWEHGRPHKQAVLKVVDMQVPKAGYLR
jgi:hypothetical protein